LSDKPAASALIFCAHRARYHLGIGSTNDSTNKKGTAMLHYAVVFFVIALIAAIFGFGGIAAGAVEIAKILFFVFLLMAAVTFVVSLIRRGK
jgi:uncharacterized membrane protein YtjA (UPF0391 family)